MLSSYLTLAAANVSAWKRWSDSYELTGAIIVIVIHGYNRGGKQARLLRETRAGRRDRAQADVRVPCSLLQFAPDTQLLLSGGL